MFVFSKWRSRSYVVYFLEEGRERTLGTRCFFSSCLLVTGHELLSLVPSLTPRLFFVTPLVNETTPLVVMPSKAWCLYSCKKSNKLIVHKGRMVFPSDIQCNQQ